MTQTQIAYDEAAKAIAEGKAMGRALWVLLSDEHDRDGYAYKPLLWEGPGNYQLVNFDDGRSGFVRVAGWKSLKTDWPERSKEPKAIPCTKCRCPKCAPVAH